MTLIIVGDFVSSDMEQQIREVFGAEPPGETPPPFRYPEPRWDPVPVCIPTAGEALVIEWTWAGPDPRSPAFLAAECITELVCGDDSALLNKADPGPFPGQRSAPRGAGSRLSRGDRITGIGLKPTPRSIGRP